MVDGSLETRGDAIQDRLADLGEQFNTNKQFGLMGYIENQQETAAPAAKVADPEDDEKPPEWFESVNSSLRALKDTTEGQFGQIRSELSSLRQPAPAVAASEDFGSEDPYGQKIGQLEQTVAHTRLNTAWERARNSLNSAKQKYGADFEFQEGDLQNAWKQHIGNNVQAAESTNWDIYFQQQHDSRRAPKLEQRVSQLQAELSNAKQGGGLMNNMAALPRGNRNGAPTPAANANGDFDEDIYRRATARMGKGRFMGFNRALNDEQNKKLLRAAG